MKILIFTTHLSNDYYDSPYLHNIPKFQYLPLTNIFLGYSDFNYNNLLRFDFFDSFGTDVIKLVINFNYIPEDNSIYLADEVIHKINKTDNAYLWMLNPFEAKIIEEDLLSYIDTHPIKNDKVIVSTSNVEYSKRTINGVKFIGLQDWWEGHFAHQIKHYSEVSYIHPDRKRLTIDTAQKKFICLNRNQKQHRIWSYYNLLDSPAFEEGHISYHAPDMEENLTLPYKEQVKWALEFIKKPIKEDLVELLFKTKSLDKIDEKNVINHGKGIQPFYHDTLFSIITESLIDQEFITEKTFKAMMHGHPFVFVGCPANLDRLKAKGYMTFEDIFEIKAIERPDQLEKFLTLVHRIPLEEWRQRIKEVWDRVEHNYHLFLGSDHLWENVSDSILKTTEQDRTSGYFCMAPWVHMSIWPNGDAYPCCVYDWKESIGNVNDLGIEGVWNSEKMRKLRLDLINGEKPEGCKRCTTLDDQHIFSYRRKITEDYKHHRPLVDQTKEDGTVEKVNLAYFDIRFSNLCNMKCRSCGPHFSSKWAEDTIGRPEIIEINHEEAWEEIEKYIDTIEEIYFTGGESLFQEQHYKLLDMIIEKGKHPKLVYNSNGSRLDYKGKKVINYWNKINNKIEFQVSLDQIGTKAEYARHGQKWSTIDNNLKYIRDNMSNVEIIPNPTVSVLNILDLDKIIKYLFDNRLATNYNINLNNILMTPEWLNIQILPKPLKAEAETRLRSLIEHLNEYEDMDYYTKNYYIDCLPKIINMMWEKDESHKIEEFKKEMKNLDTIRDENFIEVYPELKELYA